MAVLLFKLNNVPDDEAQDIRALLGDNNISFYETDAGFFRVGLDAIWLPDESEAERARELLRAYQIQRTKNQQQNYALLLEQGAVPTLWQKFCAQPIRFILLLIAIVFVAGITLIPFLMLLRI